jgi:FAS-associated factor 2
MMVKEVRDAEGEVGLFESLLPPNHPTLFVGSLQDAIAHAKSSFKFLVVYLHSEMHQDASNFIEKVFCDQTVIEVLNRNFVVWAGDVSLAGPHMVSMQLNIDGFPAMCVYAPSIFVPRSHMAVLNDARISLPLQLYKLADTSNNVDMEDVLHMLTGVVDQYKGWISAVHRNAREAEANRQLLEDQDNAYQISLRMDEERAAAEALEVSQRIEAERSQRLLIEAQAEQDRRRQEEAEMEAARAIAELTESRERAFQRLSKEPSPDDPDAVSITFRATDANRITRRFNKNETVAQLYDFCRTIESTPNQFSLATPYPRRTLSNMAQSISELNINKAILTIEPA